VWRHHKFENKKFKEKTLMVGSKKEKKKATELTTMVS
jgi:hypothetical protein